MSIGINSVRTNVASLNAYRQLSSINKLWATPTQRLASGYKINKAADDASGLSVSMKLLAQLEALSKSSTNAQDGISLVQTAEGAMGSVHDILGRMTELAGRAANSTLDDTDRGALQSEWDALRSEIDRISASTNFNNINLLDGSLTNLEMQVGDTADSYNKVSVSVGDLSAKGLGLEGLSLADPSSASAALAQLRSSSGAINTVSQNRSTLGAMENRLAYTINNLDNTYENTAAALSRIRDADMAEETMEYTKYLLLNKAAQSVLGHSNIQAMSVLQLFR